GDAAADDGQVGGQATLAAELPQDGVVVGHDLEQHLGGQVFDVFGRQRDAAQVAGVVDDVVDQAEEAVNEVVPGAALVLEAAFQQRAVKGGECHGLGPRRPRRPAGSEVAGEGRDPAVPAYRPSA